jgi:hypothetical protein
MAASIYIYKYNDGIRFYKPYKSRLLYVTIPFGAVTSIVKKLFGSRPKVVIHNTTSMSYYNIPKRFEFFWDQVQSPSTSNVNDLITLLTSYNLGYAELLETFASSGQTTYTIDASTLRGAEDIMVFINGVLQLKDNDYTYVYATGIITFSVAMVGSEIIQVLNISK